MTNKKTKLTQSQQDIPPPIDFTSLPVLEVAEMLRTLGEKQLESLLSGQRRPDLRPFLPASQARLLLTPSIWQMGHWQRLGYLTQWLRHPFSRLFKRPAAGSQYKQSVTRAMTGHLSSSQWHPHIVAQLKQDLGIVSPPVVPDELWPLVNHLAWRDLTFQHRIATQIREHLRQRVLFALGEMPLIVLSPQTFWVLIALAAVITPVNQPILPTSSIFRRIRSILERLRLWNWLFRLWVIKVIVSQRTIRKAIQRLQDEAQRQALTAGWAGFWDQWIISLALQQWPGAERKLDPPLRDALQALPILTLIEPTAVRSSQEEKADNMPINLANPSWQEEMPQWVLSRNRR